VKNGSDAGFNVGLIDDDLFKWSVCLFGPNDTIYEVRILVNLMFNIMIGRVF